MPTTKAPTTVDELGLRTHCTDGHRICWPESVRQMRVGDWYGKPRSLDAAQYGICSAGNVWDQQQTPTKTLRSWEMKGETTKYKINGPPRLEHSKYGLLGGGHGTALFTVTFNAVGARTVRCEVQCDRSRFRFGDEEERSEHPHPNTDNVKTDADWFIVVRKLRGEGWQMYPRVQCPSCQAEQAAYEAYMKRMTDAALALEQEQPNVIQP